eukprot:scaffold33529_cov116-Skeletonema_dohrnii-CCMP3373.AAC.3
MGRIMMLVVQQARSAEWRRRRTRGGMVTVFIVKGFVPCRELLTYQREGTEGDGGGSTLE